MLARRQQHTHIPLLDASRSGHQPVSGACTLSSSADARSWSGCCRPLVKYQELFNRKVVHLLNQAVPNPGYLSFGLSEATERASVRQ